MRKYNITDRNKDVTSVCEYLTRASNKVLAMSENFLHKTGADTLFQRNN